MVALLVFFDPCFRFQSKAFTIGSKFFCNRNSADAVIPCQSFVPAQVIFPVKCSDKLVKRLREVNSRYLEVKIGKSPNEAIQRLVMNPNRAYPPTFKTSRDPPSEMMSFRTG